jgi:hypothetical protein
VDDIARARLDAEDKLHLKAADTLHRELLQELDRCVPLPVDILPRPPFLLIMLMLSARERFPLVERAVADVPALADPEFASGIRGHAENLLRRSQGVVIPAVGGGSGGTSALCPFSCVLVAVTDCNVFFFGFFFFFFFFVLPPFSFD